ncbi:MarR family transcriptional regulator [Paenibacillus beijingensis]|uniref:MarR family transcriptional regulator n=1 Tax=Paenibacillus beijingensis TaxID=1126833 RepID=A0A0D5NRL5_9BACL|nr:MarR family transcriptional regulator [Paenibacillus beijingensis]
MHQCLFFTVNRLSRAITKMAEEEFAITGLSPMYGYLIRLVIGSPGISHKELSEKLAITSSTLTRFIDKLEGKQLVERNVQGKNVYLYPTDKSKELLHTIRNASKNLHLRYDEILGKEFADQLTENLERSSEKLEKH